jgi:hypothetical protein
MAIRRKAVDARNAVVLLLTFLLSLAASTVG